MNPRRAAGSLGLVAAIAVSLTVTSPTAFADTKPGAGTAVGSGLQDDFNGDGYSDVVFPAPEATVNGKAAAGYVAVMYGSATGLKTSSKQVFHQDTPGLPGTVEAGDEYGSSVTSADLDRDGYADLIVGTMGEDIAAAGPDAGSLAVIWGSGLGLAGSTLLLDGPEAYDEVGLHAVTGDVNGDGRQDVVTVSDRRDLRVFSGPFGRDGVPAGTQDVPDTYGNSRILDLASGDLNGDGITDLAAVANDGDEYDARRVQYWEGTTSAGLFDYRIIKKADGGVLQGGENLDTGDVNADGFDDIVIGRSHDGYDSDVDIPLARGGMITYLPGEPSGPDVSQAHSFNQDSSGIPGVAEGYEDPTGSDHFGTGVSVGDVDGDGYADVATGLPGEDFDDVHNGGSAIVMKGTPNGLTGIGATSYSQNTDSVPGVAEDTDAFGSATKLVDVDHNGTAELVVGANGENENAGSIWVFTSTASGVTPTGSITFGAGTLGTVAAKARLGSGFNF